MRGEEEEEEEWGSFMHCVFGLRPLVNVPPATNTLT